MTPTEAMPLGARYLACFPDDPSHGWRPGMLVLYVPDSPEGERDLESRMTTEPTGYGRVVSTRDGCVTVAWEDEAGCAGGGLLLSDDVPDLRDPATLGAALGVLREVWGPDAHVFVRWAEDYRPDGGPTSVTADRGYVAQVQDTDNYGASLWTPKRTSSTPAEAIVCAAEAWAATQNQTNQQEQS